MAFPVVFQGRRLESAFLAVAHSLKPVEPLWRCRWLGEFAVSAGGRTTAELARPRRGKSPEL